MSGLYQLEMSFNAKEDRILFKLHTQDFSEFHMWLTRRYVQILWQALSQLRGEEEKELDEEDDIKQKVSEKFDAEQAAKQPGLQQKFATNISRKPLGDTPILLTRIAVKRNQNDQAVLCLHPEEGHGFELVASEFVIHSFCKLLVEAIPKTGWGLDLVY